MSMKKVRKPRNQCIFKYNKDQHFKSVGGKMDNLHLRAAAEHSMGENGLWGWTGCPDGTPARSIPAG